MTLADLCTSLIEGESVIHSFANAVNPEVARVNVSQAHITEAARALKVFTRRDLMVATGCSFGAAKHWTKLNAPKLVEAGHISIGGGAAVVWRFR